MARLSSLIDQLALETLVAGDAEVGGIVTDSRLVSRGDLYFARQGWHVDANNFVVDALARGASALVVTRRDAVPPGCPVPALLCSAEDRDLGYMADRFWDHPSRRLKVFAVTGTNGKTSTTFMTAHLLRALGERPMLIGTVRHEFDGNAVVARNTTPDGLFVHGFCAQNLALGATALVIEASSHGLELERIAGLAIDSAGFTNLTHDHLDFHKTVDAYRAAKAKLFGHFARESREAGKHPVGVIVVDNAEGVAMCAAADGCDRVVRVSAQGAPADVSLRRLPRLGELGTWFEGRVFGHEVSGVLPMIGAHNLENAAVALGMVAAQFGDRIDRIVAAFAGFAGVPGRLELVCRPQPGEPPVFVDYAHSPDAIEHVVDAVIESVGEPVTVAGCGGDRDSAKRPPMGEAASRRAAFCVLTSDNPRSEDPDAILAQMRAGVASERASKVEVIADRSLAIETAIRRAATLPVLVLGKGHETTQEVAGRRFHFADAEEARRALRALASGHAARELGLLAGWSPMRLATALGGRLVRSGDARGFSGLSTDTRSLRADAVFVALKGERYDAHDHLRDALGAGALVVAEASRVPAEYTGTVVECAVPIEALGRLAAALVLEAKQRVEPLHVVAITGSNGKTSVKEMTAAIARAVRGDDAVLATTGNLNNHIGVPLTVGRIAPAHRLAVVEMGANQPNDIYELVTMAPPDVAVLTSIGRAHLEGFGGTVDHVRRAKIGIASRAPRLLVLPRSEADNPTIRAGIDARTTIVTFGRDDATIVVMRDAASSHVHLSGNGPLAGWSAVVPLRYPGDHNALNLAAAVLANSVLAADGSLVPPHPSAIEAAMHALDLPGGRLRESTAAGRVIIDDAYNANPDSVVASLGVLASRGAMRVAVLGEMLELGPDAATLHAEIGAVAARSAEAVVCVGEAGRWIAAGAGERAVVVDSTDEAVAWVVQNAGPGATILVKASRGARLERVVVGLNSHWAEA